MTLGSDLDSAFADLNSKISALDKRVTVLETAPVIPPQPQPSFKRFFADNSSWNVLVPNNVTYRDAPELRSLGWGWNQGKWSVPTYPDDPSRWPNKITLTGQDMWSGKTGLSYHWNVDPAINGSSPPGGDMEAAVVALDGNVYSFFGLQNKVFTGVGMCPVTGDGFTGMNGFRAGVRAVQCSGVGGLIVKEDVDAGVIHHAIALQLPSSCLSKSFVPPALGTDSGVSGNAGSVPYGARLIIPKNTTKPKDLSLSGSMIWDACVNYGMLVVDRSTGAGPWIEPLGVDTAWSDTLYPDINRIRDALRVVTS